jgi:hypothetical protein
LRSSFLASGDVEVAEALEDVFAVDPRLATVVVAAVSHEAPELLRTMGCEVFFLFARFGDDRDDASGDADETHLGEVSPGDGVDAGANLIKFATHGLWDL